MKILKSISETSPLSKEIWGINTEKFQRVQTILYSPNHWDDVAIGNKHYFFMLKDCVNPDNARGFYNEFLNNNLTEHRKVFEILGNKMKVEHSPDQLSGLGFSSTKNDKVLCKVSGAFNRTIGIVF